MSRGPGGKRPRRAGGAALAASALLALSVLLAGCAVGPRAPSSERPPTAPPPPAAAGPPRLAWPVQPVEILSRFGAPRPGHRHSGLDLRGSPGDPVLAAAAGRVVFAGSMRGYGKTVIIEHGSRLETLYAHNRAVLVRPGERISAGQAIARVGRTGNASTDHCHFEVRRDGTPVDPLPWLTAR